MRANTIKSFRNRALAGCAAIAIIGGAAFAQETQKIAFDINAQELGDALTEFGVQSGNEVYFVHADVKGKQTKGVEGELTPGEAAKLLLAEANIDYRYDDNGTLIVGEAYLRKANLEEDSQRGGVFRIAQADQGDAVRRVNNEEEEERDTIVVTGTNIRGIAPESSPTQVFNREDIERSGAATAQEFVQTLTQNFRGGANENFQAVPNDTSVGANDGFGSSVNLRGLGGGSTLVLLNGRRIAPSSDIAGFVDISLIPVSAIDRVEVLTDGASSIYGGDAVAGVVNFVLRNDYEGVEVSARYGTVTQGDLDEYRASISAGTVWESGNALLTYEYYTRDSLSAEDRAFSNFALLPNDLLPSQERHSLIGSASQNVTDSLRLTGDILYSRREGIRDFTVLTGVAAGELSRRQTVSETINFGAGVSWNFVDDWYMDLSGSFSSADTDSLLSFLGSDEQQDVAADLWTIDAKATGTLFQVPGGGIKAAIGGQYRDEEYSRNVVPVLTRESSRKVTALFAEVVLPIVGQSNAITGLHSLDVNVSARYEDYSDFGAAVSPKVGVSWSPIESVRFRGSYGTSFKPPVLGRLNVPQNGIAFPTSFINAVLGLTPADPSIADVVLLELSGTSKNLQPEESRAFTGGIDIDHSHGPHTLHFSSTYFDIEFEGRLNSTPIPGNQSTFNAANIAFNSPELFPEGSVIFFPTTSQLTDVLNGLDSPPVSILGADPLNASIISNVQLIRNLARTEVRGLDFDFNYVLAADFGSVNFGLNVSYLIDFKGQGSNTTPLVEQINTLFNPIDLNLRGRIGVVRDGLSANLFVNHANDYFVDSTVAATPVESWTTFDLSLAYNVGDKTDYGVFDNAAFRLSIRNLFDENPPSTPSNEALGILGYDVTNASPLGRFISFEITKRW